MAQTLYTSNLYPPIDVDPWVTIFTGSVNLAAAAAGTYAAALDAVTTNQAVGGQAYALVTQWIDPADYPILARTPQYRLVANFQQNNVASSGTTVYTAGLYPVAPAGTTTTWNPTLGTLVTGSTAAVTGGAANTDVRVISSTFTALTADAYTFAVVVTVATGAGGKRVNMRLEYSYL